MEDTALLLTWCRVYCRGDRVTPTSSRSGSVEEQRVPPTTDEERPRAGPEMSADELRRKTKSIVDEYLHLNDFKVLRVILASFPLPLPQIDIIRAVVIVWSSKGKIIRSVLCSIVCNNCTQ